jgi:hypothetical protein
LVLREHGVLTMLHKLRGAVSPDQAQTATSALRDQRAGCRRCNSTQTGFRAAASGAEASKPTGNGLFA